MKSRVAKETHSEVVLKHYSPVKVVNVSDVSV